MAPVPWKHDGRLDAIQFGIRTRNPIGVLCFNNQPSRTALFGNHCEQTIAWLPWGHVLILVALKLPAPMNDHEIRSHKAYIRFERYQRGSFEATRKQSGVIDLEISSSVEPISADVYKVHVFGHDLGQFIATMRIPGSCKRLRNIPDGALINLFLSEIAILEGEEEKKQDAQ